MKKKVYFIRGLPIIAPADWHFRHLTSMGLYSLLAIQTFPPSMAVMEEMPKVAEATLAMAVERRFRQIKIREGFLGGIVEPISKLLRLVIHR